MLRKGHRRKWEWALARRSGSVHRHRWIIDRLMDGIDQHTIVHLLSALPLRAPGQLAHHHVAALLTVQPSPCVETAVFMYILKDCINICAS